MESNVNEETIKNEIIDMCLLLEKEFKRLEKEWQVKRKKNVQFEQQCSELNKQIIIFKGEEAEQNSWDVIGIRECGVEVKILEENQITQEELVESVHSIDEHSQTGQLDDQVISNELICSTDSNDLSQIDQVTQNELIGSIDSSNSFYPTQHQIAVEEPIESSYICNDQFQTKPQLVLMNFESGKLIKSNPHSIQLQDITGNDNVNSSTESTHQVNVTNEIENKSFNDVGDQIDYPCQYPGCGRVFKRQSFLANHQKVHQIINQCQYPGCGLLFKNKSHLTAHRNIHLNKYQCRVCQKSFKSPSDLRVHHRVHTGEKKFVCGLIGCGKRFTQKSGLNQHIKFVHFKKRPFQCNENGCKKSFPSNHQLQQHLTSHSSARPFPCQVEGCDWQAKRKFLLARHVMYYHSDFTFRCDFEHCEKTFKRRYQLKYHQSENHEDQQQFGEKKFECTWIECEKRFYKKVNLKIHLKRVHLKERPIKCDEVGCGKSFPNNSELQRHLKLAHSSDRPIQCQFPGCESRFKLKSNLTKHVNRVHLDSRYST